MATRIRLRRMGAKKAPFYRIVVADSRYPRDGRFIEEIGYYDPTKNPSLIKIDEERAKYWMGTGALPSETVKTLMVAVGILAASPYKTTVAPAAGSAGTAETEAEVVMADVPIAAAEEAAELEEAGVEQAEAVAEPEEAAAVSEEAAVEQAEAVAEPEEAIVEQEETAPVAEDSVEG